MPQHQTTYMLGVGCLDYFPPLPILPRPSNNGLPASSPVWTIVLLASPADRRPVVRLHVNCSDQTLVSTPDKLSRSSTYKFIQTVQTWLWESIGEISIMILRHCEVFWTFKEQICRSFLGLQDDIAKAKGGIQIRANGRIRYGMAKKRWGQQNFAHCVGKQGFYLEK